MIKLIDENKEYKNESEVDYSQFIVKPEELNKDLKKYYNGDIKQGYSTGITILDDYLAFKEHEFYILTGKKGSGKTTINQALQLMASVNNGLIWAVCYQENDNVFMKLNLMNYLLSDYADKVYKNDIEKYKIASDFIDKHFIFLKIDSIKQGLDVARYLIEIESIDLHGLLLDPINSFENGFQNTGNNYADGVVAGLEILKFSKKYCSVHISQHPTMSGQRQEGAVTSYQGEGGWYLNKASFTYVIHREKGSSENHIIVENVRNKHTGGGETEQDNAPILYWSPTKISVYMQNDTNNSNTDVFRFLTNENNTFGKKTEIKKELPLKKLNDAFDDNIPF